MNGREAKRLLGEWLFAKTQDDNVKKQEVLSLIFAIHSSRKMTKGACEELGSYLTVGKDYCFEFLNDRCKMSDVEFWNKHFKS